LNRCQALDIEIDAPSCSLLSLEIHACFFIRVVLTRVPKLERVLCDADTKLRSIRLGYVPCLRAINLSAEHLIYCRSPIQLSPAFHNLRNISLFNLDTPDMAWILFVLEAAPFLSSLYIKVCSRQIIYSLRSILLFANTDVSSSKMCLDTSVLAKSNTSLFIISSLYVTICVRWAS
jgi:hypothetical protein